MSVCVTIVDGPVRGSSSINPDGAGAMVYFEGVVRPQEDGQSIVALDYQVYEPMAGRKMEQIAWRTSWPRCWIIPTW